jgi:hypothetical protein
MYTISVVKFFHFRIPYRIRKWWFGIYTWSLSVAAVNAWRLRMKVSGKKEPFLDFLRELVIGMFAQHGTPPVRCAFMNGFCPFHLYFFFRSIPIFFMES